MYGRPLGIQDAFEPSSGQESAAKRSTQAVKCAGSKVVATVRGGDATVSGMIKNEHERKPIIRTIQGVQGIRRVIDQLRVIETKRVVHQPRPQEKPPETSPPEK